MEDRIMSVAEYEKELADEKKAAAESAGLKQRPTPKQAVALERVAILDVARECVCHNREADYGSPEDSFGMIARLWSAYTGYEFNPADVAVMMVLLKAARIAGGSRSMDNWVDIAGYAACGGEIIGRTMEREAKA